MWDFFPNLFFNYPNLGRNNFNTIPSTNVTVGTENVTIEIPNHAFYRRNYVGSFFLDLRDAIPAGTTATLPILIGILLRRCSRWLIILFVSIAGVILWGRMMKMRGWFSFPHFLYP